MVCIYKDLIIVIIILLGIHIYGVIKAKFKRYNLHNLHH